MKHTGGTTKKYTTITTPNPLPSSTQGKSITAMLTQEAITELVKTLKASFEMGMSQTAEQIKDLNNKMENVQIHLTESNQ